MNLGVVLAVGLAICHLGGPWSHGQLSLAEHRSAGERARAEGRYVEAEALYRTALQDAEKAGASDPIVADLLNSLALALRAQGRYERLASESRQP